MKSLVKTLNGLNSAEVELQSPDWAEESIFIFMSTSSRKTWDLEGFRSHRGELIFSKESWLTQQCDGAIGSKRRWPSLIDRAFAFHFSVWLKP
ncbi:hypothetical protein DPMN_030721 [Dreissena polymorpha]|uniref:Uncharacterized protein n=1 Tax=Dreissena polymorpha TaxID=45954 RepID=A0A9D4M0W1_DREPO|nr:hypothetical protein DPMN_030721 [Dreissena polymorpha]